MLVPPQMLAKERKKRQQQHHGEVEESMNYESEIGFWSFTIVDFHRNSQMNRKLLRIGMLSCFD